MLCCYQFVTNRGMVEFVFDSHMGDFCDLLVICSQRQSLPNNGILYEANSES